jgi:hypothetical protein
MPRNGYRAAFRDPARAVAAMAKSVPNLNTAIAVEEVKIVQRIALRPDQRGRLGFQTTAMIKSTVDAVEKTLLKASLGKPIAALYSNAYVG